MVTLSLNDFESESAFSSPPINSESKKKKNNKSRSSTNIQASILKFEVRSSSSELEMNLSIRHHRMRFE